jgi:hypothetical protein
MCKRGKADYCFTCDWLDTRQFEAAVLVHIRQAVDIMYDCVSSSLWHGVVHNILF